MNLITLFRVNILTWDAYTQKSKSGMSQNTYTYHEYSFIHSIVIYKYMFSRAFENFSNQHGASFDFI